MMQKKLHLLMINLPYEINAFVGILNNLRGVLNGRK